MKTIRKTRCSASSIFFPHRHPACLRRKIDENGGVLAPPLRGDSEEIDFFWRALVVTQASCVRCIDLGIVSFKFLYSEV